MGGCGPGAPPNQCAVEWNAVYARAFQTFERELQVAYKAFLRCVSVCVSVCVCDCVRDCV